VRGSLLFLIAVVGVVTVACGRPELEGGETLGCVPGAQVFCACPGDQTGVQVCRDDGMALLACQCDDVPAGSGGSFAAGGTEGMSTGGSQPNEMGGAGGNAGSSGSTATWCPDGKAVCGAECVDPDNNARHCGSCDNACQVGQACRQGKCQKTCPPDQSDCEGACVPLATDAKNCGSCGTVCDGALACIAGACTCRTGWAACNGDCIDPMTSDDHCGGCGANCEVSLRCVSGECSAAYEDWPTLGYDMQRTGVSPERGGPPARTAWSAVVGTAPLNPVVVERGRVVVTARTRHQGVGPVKALRARDAEELWSYDFGNVADVGQPTLVDGRVYVQHQRGTDIPDVPALFSLDVASGDVLWRAPFSAQWAHYWAPAVSADAVYVNGGSYGGLYGFDRKTGSSLFFIDELEQYDEWSPTLVEDGVLTMTEGNLRLHDRDSGSITWTASFIWDWRGWSMGASVPVRDGVAYALVPPTLYAVRLSDRHILWEVTSEFRSFPAVSDDHIFAIDGSFLVALERDGGKTAWKYEAEDLLLYPPIASAGHVYVASDDGVRAISVATGDEVWEDDNGGWLSLGNGKLFVARIDGVLTAYELARPGDEP
jgi:hypothetical protein